MKIRGRLTTSQVSTPESWHVAHVKSISCSTCVYSIVLLIPTLTINDTAHLYSVYKSWLHRMGTRDFVSILLALKGERPPTQILHGGGIWQVFPWKHFFYSHLQTSCMRLQDFFLILTNWQTTWHIDRKGHVLSWVPRLNFLKKDPTKKLPSISNSCILHRFWMIRTNI